MKLQINEFGQTPKQLFKHPHPARHDFDVKFYKEPSKSITKYEENKQQMLDANEDSNEEDGEFEIIEKGKENKVEPVFTRNGLYASDEEKDEQYEKARMSMKEEQVSPKLIESTPEKSRSSEMETLWDGKGIKKLKMDQVAKVHKR